MTGVRTITVIGGGLSGSLVVLQLLDRLKSSPSPIEIHWVEPRARLGRGIAYETENPSHLLNVPAGRMGIDPDDPTDFFRWVESRKPEAKATDFLPRKLYGEYIESLVKDAWTRAGTTLTRHIAEAERIEIFSDHAIVHLSDGTVVQSNHVVLAIGNSRPGDVPIADRKFYDSPRYLKDPRDDHRLKVMLESLPRESRILILGSGLTMMDTVMTLRIFGRDRQITVLSRRGFLPSVHRAGPAASTWKPEFDGKARKLFHEVLSRARWAGEDWRGVIDGIRPHLPEIWRALDAKEKRRFLRHIQPLWDTHRHRVAPEIDRTMKDLKSQGALKFLAGRLIAIEESPSGATAEIRLRGANATKKLEFDLVLNCTGPESNPRRARSTLIDALLLQGTLRVDPLELGLDALPDGTLLGADGAASSVLSTIGPPLKGVLWETTAVPEICVQARALAKRLLP